LVAVVDATVTTVVVAVAVGSVRLDGLALAARGARVELRSSRVVVTVVSDAWVGSGSAHQALAVATAQGSQWTAVQVGSILQ
jgi:hypothetical protein